MFITKNNLYIFQIAIDFSYLFPEAAKDFSGSLNIVSSKLHRILSNGTKNVYMKSLLDIYQNVNSNSKIAILLIGLHHELFTRRGGKKLSIIDASKFMIVLTDNPNIDIVIQERRDHMAKLKCTLQPFIIARGIEYSCLTDEIVVVFDNIKYMFASLSKAIACLLQIYDVFDLEWPKFNEQVYSYLDHLLLAQDRPKVSDSKLNILMTKLSTD